MFGQAEVMGVPSNRLNLFTRELKTDRSMFSESTSSTVDDEGQHLTGKDKVGGRAVQCISYKQ